MLASPSDAVSFVSVEATPPLEVKPVKDLLRQLDPLLFATA